jgi:uncharacterized repeat protein (TIGR01451 family)
MAFDGVPRILRDQVSGDKFTATGQTRTFIGTITDSTKPFRVTLAWTDAPGATSGSASKNDLDLTVTVGGNTYKGNVFGGSFSTTGGVADNQNNVESVFLPAGFSGRFTITVSAANINSDGVPNEAPALDQDFALVVYNALLQPAVLTIDSSALLSENCSPTNGAIDPGESVSVTFALRNTGTGDTANLVATLLSTNGVIPLSGPISYGVLAAGGGAVTQAFSFLASGSCGGTISPVLQLQDGTNDLGTTSTSFPLGVQVVTTRSFTNAANINVPASGTIGKASPYPSTIVVSGITGFVSKVTVTLSGVTHTFPDDIDALLVGPTGLNVMIMSDCGGGGDINGVTLTFDDDAASLLPDSTQIVSGTYKPSNFVGADLDNLPAPAPAAPFGSTLSPFKGLNPNGTWSLYVQDDANNDSGNISSGWRLSITTSNSICCSGSVAAADLAIGQSATPLFTNVNGRITFTLNVTNLGPNSASSVTVTDTFPAGLSFVSANLSQGTATNNGNAVTCNLGTLASGATAFIGLQAIAITNGVQTNIAHVSSVLFDPAGANNTAAATVTILVPSPVIQSIIQSNGVVTFTWSAIVGQTYRVQYKDNLLDPVWNDLLPDVTASGPTASKSVLLSASPQRFYRIVVP